VETRGQRGKYNPHGSGPALDLACRSDIGIALVAQSADRKLDVFRRSSPLSCDRRSRGRGGRARHHCHLPQGFRSRLGDRGSRRFTVKPSIVRPFGIAGCNDISLIVNDFAASYCGHMEGHLAGEHGEDAAVGFGREGFGFEKRKAFIGRSDLSWIRRSTTSSSPVGAQIP
jgi:hypothetical protein